MSHRLSLSHLSTKSAHITLNKRVDSHNTHAFTQPRAPSSQHHPKGYLKPHSINPRGAINTFNTHFIAQITTSYSQAHKLTYITIKHIIGY